MSLLNKLGMIEAYNSETVVSTNAVWAIIFEESCHRWAENIYQKPKLRTYVKFKEAYTVEPYVLSFISRRQRSITAQLRCGILPLAIETGRWYGVDYNLRHCKLCNSGEVENEEHFVFLCNYFDEERAYLMSYVQQLLPDFSQKSINEKFQCLMSKECIVKFSQYVANIYNKRQSKLFI